MTHHGIAKGMRRVLSERGYDVSDTKKWTKKPLMKLMQLQPDFKNQKPELQLLIEKLGHKVMFLPRFHCELNQIEQYWMHGKREYKDQNFMVESTSQFEKNVDICLNKIDEKLAHKIAKHARKYLNAYHDNKST